MGFDCKVAREALWTGKPDPDQRPNTLAKCKGSCGKQHVAFPNWLTYAARMQRGMWKPIRNLAPGLSRPRRPHRRGLLRLTNAKMTKPLGLWEGSRISDTNLGLFHNTGTAWNSGIHFDFPLNKPTKGNPAEKHDHLFREAIGTLSGCVHKLAGQKVSWANGRSKAFRAKGATHVTWPSCEMIWTHLMVLGSLHNHQTGAALNPPTYLAIHTGSCHRGSCQQKF